MSSLGTLLMNGMGRNISVDLNVASHHFAGLCRGKL